MHTFLHIFNLIAWHTISSAGYSWGVRKLEVDVSLLASGIKKVNGKFNKGDHIKILHKFNKEFERGLCSFSSSEVEKILGHHSKEIKKILGYTAKSEVVHKDDMVEI